MARDNCSYKEVAAKVNKAFQRKTRTRSKRRVVRLYSEEPKTYNAKERSVSASNWATFTDSFTSASANTVVNKSKYPKESTIFHRDATTGLPTSLFNTQAKIFALLKALIGGIRCIFANLHTPVETAEFQILETVILVMDCLERLQ